MGISPGPDTLRDFSFFHKFGDNNVIINRMKFDVIFLMQLRAEKNRQTLNQDNAHIINFNKEQKS